MRVSNVGIPTDQHPSHSVANQPPQTLQAVPVDKSQLVGLVDKIKTTIDMLGDTLKALDISERESLRPMWGVVKEGLEILNGEPDDWDFSSTTTQDQLKQLSLILNLHGQKFKGYINAEQQKQPNLTSFGKVCKILFHVCEALSSELEKITPADGMAHSSTLDDSTNHMSKLEFLTLKTQLSAINDPAIQKLAEPLNSAWNCASSAEVAARIAFDFSDGSGMNSKTVDKLTKVHQELTKEIDSLEEQLKSNSPKLSEPANPNDNTKDITNKCQQVLAHVKQVKINLENRISEIKDYQSPDTKQKICNAKKIEIQATINVLKSQKNQTTEIKSLINTLEKRLASLNKFSKTEPEKNFTNSQLLGKKEIKGMGKVFNFSLAIKQQSLLRHMANQITDSNNPDSGSLATEHFTERMLMQSVLEKAGVKDASKQLKASISRELNSNKWSTIKSEFTVPIKDNAHQSQAGAIVTTTTKHAGEIFSDPNLIQITSTDSPITATTTAEYTHTDKDGNTVTGGFNSHCSTEVHHVTTAANTSSSVDGKEDFGGTRHGTLAPYGLDEAGIKAIHDEELGQTLQSLFGKAKVKPTTITAGGASSTNTASSKSATTIHDDPLRKELVEKLKTILLNSTTGDQWLAQCGTNRQFVQTTLGMLDTTVENLLTNPAQKLVLASLVKANPELGQLLQRQGALNRAREVFILEMTRNPQFLEQIKKGEEVLFTSVGLLTPDNLRHQLHKLFGFSASSDEKEMVAIQAQAWDDLRKEIKAQRIVINGSVVKAEIIDFNIGVNKGATVLATNPIIGEAVSGSEYANTLVNNKSRDRLQKATTNRLSKMQTDFNKKINQRTSSPPTNSDDLKKLDNEIKALSRDIATIKELSAQIEAMWEDGSYREAGNEPYKLASRVALLSHLLGGGTAFNCKSGKDRTAQLDVEVKFLAFQIRTSNGKVPKPDRKRTNLEKVQFATFIFFDESRRKMQEFNTGYGGSKLVSQPALYGNFTPSTGDAKADGKNKAATIQQFQGLSKAVSS
jgi:hypothetical protein